MRVHRLPVFALAVASALAGALPAAAASHREAPAISLDSGADITDFFMFRSYEPGRDDKLVLVMDVMSEEPSSGPNYWNFDPNVVYQFSLDNDRDGLAKNVVFQVRFRSELRGVNADLGLFTSYIALPPITNLDGPGSEGLGLRQRYDVVMIKNGRPRVLGTGLIAVPSNVGPRTTPSYESNLASEGIYDLGGGIRVFAGQRDDPFYIDLGAVFDTLNLRSPGTDMLSGFNVSTIALEIPIDAVTADGGGADETSQPLLGAYASTLRGKDKLPRLGKIVRARQAQRLANPLVNEAIIGTVDKDRWNATDPEDEAQFLDYYENLRLATALELVFGFDATPALNVRDLLLKYDPADAQLSELLRLDLRTAPVPLASQKRLSVLDGDPAGWPNGRRPLDDVTDIAIRVIGGANFAAASDGANENDVPLPTSFPFLGTPHDGRGRVHANP
jgi:hypothetical protein